jgi:hypothetical protein
MPGRPVAGGTPMPGRSVGAGGTRWSALLHLICRSQIDMWAATVSELPEYIDMWALTSNN